MDKVFTVALPLFTMILCGFTLVRIGVIGKEAVQGIVAAVFWLFLPFFIFMKTISAQSHGGLNWRLLGAYYLACLVVFLLAAFGGRILWGGDSRTACLRGLASISGVVGYMGLPLMVMAFGDRAVLPAVMITMADNLVILAGGALMMELTGRGFGGSFTNINSVTKSIGKSISSNPLLLAVAAAILYLAFGLRLPEPLRIFATQMTDATGPLALVALGAALATHTKVAMVKPDTVVLVAFKIMLLPLLVFLSTKYLFDLDEFSVRIAVLMAALPVAVNVFILASRYKSYEAEASSTMLLSTILGVFTVSGLLIILG